MVATGLAHFFKEIQRPVQLSDFCGQTLAVDGCAWLRGGVLTYGLGLENKYVQYAIQRVQKLQEHGIKPYIVFSGGQPLARRRFHADAEAVDITPEMIHQLTKFLRVTKIDYVVAPYEANAQLAFLEKLGIVNGVLTEDFLIPFAFGCNNILSKLRMDGRCIYTERNRLGEITEINLTEWSDARFRRWLMLSGCGYIPSIPGVGPLVACNFLGRQNTVEDVVSMLQVKGFKVPDHYMETFNMSELALVHQRVYDPNNQQVVTLNPLPEWVGSHYDSMIGSPLSPDIARGVATGMLHPFTFLPIVDFNPSFYPAQRATAHVPTNPAQHVVDYCVDHLSVLFGALGLPLGHVA